MVALPLLACVARAFGEYRAGSVCQRLRRLPIVCDFEAQGSSNEVRFRFLSPRGGLVLNVHLIGSATIRTFGAHSDENNTSVSNRGSSSSGDGRPYDFPL